MLPDFQNHIHSLDEDLRELNSSNINKLAEKVIPFVSVVYMH